MTLMQHSTTRDLINTIEQKDRHFRTAWVLFMMIVLLALLGVIYVQQRTLVGVNEQLKQQKILLNEQKATAAAVNKNTTEQLGKVSSQIDCIAAFFTQRNRTEVIITDLQQCQIIRPDGTIATPQTGAGTNNTQQQPQSQSPGSANSSGQTPSNGQQNNQPTTPTTPPENPPAEVLGIPVCVPFTGVCVR